LAVLYYCDHHEFPLPPGHKFPVRKYAMLRSLLAAETDCRFEPAALAPIESIERAHDAAYVRGFIDGTLPPNVMRRIGFPWSEALVRRTLASAGGTLAAARHALEHGFGGNLAGGTHHAFRAEGSGFCVFNDLAIAILELRAVNGIERAAVIDLDVHQGDGTAQIFESDPAVLTLSMHGRNNFPFRKQRSRIDVELDDGTGDGEYLTALDRVLPRVFDHRPGAVFFQAGVDALATDTLGRLSLTPAGLLERDRNVIGAARRYGAPLIVVLGGGYSNPIELTVQAHAQTFRELLTAQNGSGEPADLTEQRP
jgi:acetoin utilization deacetylase AcuC-like enzyme